MHETGELPEEFVELDKLARQEWFAGEGDDPTNNT